MDITAHGVTKVEICNTFLSNHNSRTLRITTVDAHGAEVATEICMYGATDVLDALPKSADFSAYDPLPATA